MLLLQMPAIRAEEDIREGNLTPEGLYNAVLAMTGSKDKAETARARKMLAEARRHA